MKFFMLSFLFLFTVIQSEYLDLSMKDRYKIALECIQQIGIDKSVIYKAMKTLVFPKSDQKYKDFLACSYKKQGFQGKDGKILYDNLEEFLTKYYKREDLKVLDVCRNLIETSDSEAAFNAMECVMREVEPLVTLSNSTKHP